MTVTSSRSRCAAASSGPERGLTSAGRIGRLATPPRFLSRNTASQIPLPAAAAWRLLSLLAVLLAACPAAADDDPAVQTVGDAFHVSGRVPDVRQQARYGSHRFRVLLSDLKYSGKAARTLLERTDDGRLTIWIALKDMSLTIDRISLSGRVGKAVCGPTSIEMGRRRELWLAFDFRQGDGDEKSLKQTGTRFSLPRDNWSVGTPEWVRTSGFGMSRSRVVRGVRRGLAASQERIEREILELAPAILTRFAAPDIPPDGGELPLERALFRKLNAGGHLPGLAMTGF